MPATLLDLTDEILIHIAEFIHGDIEIPLPSFNPHWADFKHDIESGIHQDYLSFRSTCRKLNEIIPLRNLHLVFKNWSKLLQWKMDCPTVVMKNVKRISINISVKDKEVSPIVIGCNIDLIWSTIIQFLSEMTSLEEMIIINLPLCYHDAFNPNSNSLRIPTTNFLPSLKSLAFEINCHRCSVGLPRLFVPAAPKLEHLKLIDADKLAPLCEQWSARHTSQHKLPLQTLIYKYSSDVELIQVIENIQPFCLDLRVLHLSAFSRGNSLLPGIFLGAKPSSSSRGGWEYKSFDEKWVNDGVVEEEELASDWNENTHWHDLLNALSSFKNLRTLDCILNILVPPAETLILTPNGKTKGSIYKRKLQSARNCPLRTTSLSNLHLSAMAGAAREMITAIPTLQEGYFWQWPFDEDDEDGAGEQWKRWTWNGTGVGMEVEIDRVVERFAMNWTANTDGNRYV